MKGSSNYFHILPEDGNKTASETYFSIKTDNLAFKLAP